MVRCLLAGCFGKGGASAERKRATADVSAEEQQPQQRQGGPVLVELFSSQGCATSTEAEVLLSRLGRGDLGVEAPLVMLCYHVDYWDYMGWKDPFGSSQWTVRQKAYVQALSLDTMFTPQLVVQGRAHSIGNDHDTLLSMIRDSPTFPPPTFQATFQRPSTDTLQVSLTGALRTKVEGEGMNVMVALYENGQLTDCPSGPNKGRHLANDFVVRKLEKLCTLKNISAKKTVSGTLTFSVWETFNPAKCGIALFLQNNSLHVFGSQSFQLPHDI